MFAAQQHSTQSGSASPSSLFNRGSRANEKKNKTTTMRKTMRIQRGRPMASIPQQGGNAQSRECTFSLSLSLSLSLNYSLAFRAKRLVFCRGKSARGDRRLSFVFSLLW
jgi:hypothetical protein